MQAFMVTVAILAQGTSWAVAVTQAYFTCVGSTLQVPLQRYIIYAELWPWSWAQWVATSDIQNLGSHGERLIGDWHELYVRSLPMRAPRILASAMGIAPASGHVVRSTCVQTSKHDVCGASVSSGSPGCGRSQYRAHGVVVSHPLSMREALGSIPSVSKLYCAQPLRGYAISTFYVLAFHTDLRRQFGDMVCARRKPLVCDCEFIRLWSDACAML